MQADIDRASLNVLERALRSSSRATRLRAVAMLARVKCRDRAIWLEQSLADPDVGVRHTAMLVASWVRSVDGAPWPEREEIGPASSENAEGPGRRRQEAPPADWRWEYAGEVWRADGMLVGVFACTSCDEDDEHAKRIALGQAILASATRFGDAFEPSDAGTFIVAKARVAGPSTHGSSC